MRHGATTLPVTDAFPAPVEPARLAEPGECPAAAVTKLRLAERQGWDACLTLARGYTPDAHWQPAQVMTWEQVLGEDGRVELTPKGAPRRRRVSTGELAVVTTVAMRARRAGKIVVMVWLEGSFEAAHLTHPWRMVGSTAATAALSARC